VQDILGIAIANSRVVVTSSGASVEEFPLKPAFGELLPPIAFSASQIRLSHADSINLALRLPCPRMPTVCV
jgi:hypothetical protein